MVRKYFDVDPMAERRNGSIRKCARKSSDFDSGRKSAVRSRGISARTARFKRRSEITFSTTGFRSHRNMAGRSSSCPKPQTPGLERQCSRPRRFSGKPGCALLLHRRLRPKPRPARRASKSIGRSVRHQPLRPLRIGKPRLVELPGPGIRSRLEDFISYPYRGRTNRRCMEYPVPLFIRSAPQYAFSIVFPNRPNWSGG